jgi:hypothetical protein
MFRQVGQSVAALFPSFSPMQRELARKTVQTSAEAVGIHVCSKK